MPVEYFIRFQGKCYDVGTRLRFYGRNMGYLFKSSTPYVGTIERFDKTVCIIRGDDGETYCIYTTIQSPTRDNEYVAEIIKPVYYVEKPHRPIRRCPPAWEVEIGWVWYILIMIVGTIFKDALMIWVFASAVFFLWKNGFFNGGNK